MLISQIKISRFCSLLTPLLHFLFLFLAEGQFIIQLLPKKYFQNSTEINATVHEIKALQCQQFLS